MINHHGLHCQPHRFLVLRRHFNNGKQEADKPFMTQEAGHSHGSHDGSTIQMRRHVSCTEDCGGLSLRSIIGARVGQGRTIWWFPSVARTTGCFLTQKRSQTNQLCHRLWAQVAEFQESAVLERVRQRVGRRHPSHASVGASGSLVVYGVAPIRLSSCCGVLRQCQSGGGDDQFGRGREFSGRDDQHLVRPVSRVQDARSGLRGGRSFESRTKVSFQESRPYGHNGV